MASLPDLGGLAIFARVAECRFFTDAAAQPQPAVAAHGWRNHFRSIGEVAPGSHATAAHPAPATGLAAIRCLYMIIGAPDYLDRN